MTPSIILGIDPGQRGAVGALTIDGTVVWVEDMTDLDGTGIGSWLAERLDGEIVRVCAYEKVHSMPKQGVASTFTFGAGYGALLGALGALGIKTWHVTPQAWKREACLPADKTASRQRAAELWPTEAHLFRRVRDDGRAEALLIADWARRQLPGAT